MQKLILIGVAGGAGTLARYGVATLAQRLFGAGFPWGTVCVNLIGAFLFGLVFTLWRERGTLDPEAASILLIGVMGGFTTFSSYVNDLVGLARGARLAAAGFDFVLQNVGGVAGFLAGAALGRHA
ncbi:MAG TPA: CrcB family protein [Polyangiaceae bacterium]|nr:CrcB family protein [Polyangiaceae bacterium]